MSGQEESLPIDSGIFDCFKKKSPKFTATKEWFWLPYRVIDLDSCLPISIIFQEAAVKASIASLEYLCSILFFSFGGEGAVFRTP